LTGRASGTWSCTASTATTATASWRVEGVRPGTAADGDNATKRRVSAIGALADTANAAITNNDGVTACGDSQRRFGGSTAARVLSSDRRAVTTSTATATRRGIVAATSCTATSDDEVFDLSRSRSGCLVEQQ
jgi:hypothetical protein